MQCSWNWAKMTLAWRKKRKKRKRQASAQATAVAAAVAVRDPPLYPITRRRRHRSLLDPCPVASTSRLTSPSTVQWTKTKLYGDALWTTVPVSFSLDPVAGISNLTAPHRRPCWTALRSLPTNRRPIGDVSRSVSVSSPARNPKRQQQQSSLILLTFTASYSRPIDSRRTSRDFSLSDADVCCMMAENEAERVRRSSWCCCWQPSYMHSREIHHFPNGPPHSYSLFRCLGSRDVLILLSLYFISFFLLLLACRVVSPFQSFSSLSSSFFIVNQRTLTLSLSLLLLERCKTSLVLVLD